MSLQKILLKSKQLPTLISDLLDLAIYSFHCQSGLRFCHKVCGNPVLEGDSVSLRRMLLTSNVETWAALRKMTIDNK